MRSTADEIFVIVETLICPLQISSRIVLQILSSVGSVIVLGVLIAALVSYGSALTITTRQLICAAFFPGIGMALGYGKCFYSLVLHFYRIFIIHVVIRRCV